VIRCCFARKIAFEKTTPPYIVDTVVGLSKNYVFARTAGFFNNFFWCGFATPKNTYIRTTVRIGGIAANECGQCGCFVEKVPTGLFRRSHHRISLIRWCRHVRVNSPVPVVNTYRCYVAYTFIFALMLSMTLLLSSASISKE